MKKILMVIAITLFTLTGSVASAHNGEQSSEQNLLPSAGITPDSTFYFLDRLSENIRQFFTFSANSKVELQIEFAGERIAEIGAMVEKNGPKDKGIEKAKKLLLANVAYAAEVVNKEKAAGKDVFQFAKNIDEKFDARDKLLVQTFLDARAKLAADHKKIKENMLAEAQTIGDTKKVAELTQQLSDIEVQVKDLQNKKEDIKVSFRNEKRKIEENLKQKDRQKDEEDQSDEDKLEKQREKDQGEFEMEKEDENEGIDGEDSEEQNKEEKEIKEDRESGDDGEEVDSQDSDSSENSHGEENKDNGNREED